MVIDVEALEERVIQKAAHFRGRVAVEGIRIGYEVERMLEDAYADGELLRSAGESGFDAFAFAMEFDQLHTDFCLRHRPVGEQIDQAAFLLVEFLQLPVQPRVSVADRGLFVGYDLFQGFSALGGEGGRELERAIVLHDCFFDRFDREARQVAEAILAPAASEVRVLGAGAVSRLVEDEPGCISGAMAAGAP